MEANSNRTLCSIVFKANGTPSIDETLIAIRFATGDLLRIPLYIRTENVIFKTEPEVVDFGLV